MAELTVEKKKLVLWFDGDAFIMESLLRGLREAGYKVRIFCHRSVIEKVIVQPNKFKNCGAIIIDPIYFPDYSEMVETIRKKAHCCAPVIFFTGLKREWEYSNDEMKRLKVVSVLEKPILPSDFTQSIIQSILLS